MTPMALSAIASETCIVRDTASRPGRTIAVEPGKTAARSSPLRSDHPGDWRDAPLRVAAAGMETGLICLKGRRRSQSRARIPVVPYDALYVPRDAGFEIVTRGRMAATSRKSRRRSSSDIRCSSCDSPTCRRIRGCTSPPARRVPTGAEHPARQERPGRADHGGRDVQPAGQLDLMAAARTRGARRGGVPLHRHAASGLRRAARLRRRSRIRSSRRSCAKGTSC